MEAPTTSKSILDLLKSKDGDPTHQDKILLEIVSRKLSLRDEGWSSFLEIDKIKSDFQKILATAQQLKQASDREIAALREENQRITSIPSGTTEKGTTKKTVVFPTGILVLQLISATIVGCIVSGIIAFYYIIPQKIETQRGEDLKTLEFINSNEGKIMKAMLELNKEYFPNKCQKDARNNHISIVFKGKKEERVCVLLIP